MDESINYFILGIPIIIIAIVQLLQVKENNLQRKIHLSHLKQIEFIFDELISNRKLHNRHIELSMENTKYMLDLIKILKKN